MNDDPNYLYNVVDHPTWANLCVEVAVLERNGVGPTTDEIIASLHDLGIDDEPKIRARLADMERAKVLCCDSGRWGYAP